MNVLVDTCVWSDAFRRDPKQSKNQQKLAELIQDYRAVMLGPIRQELLSGIKHKAQFNKLKKHISSFDDVEIEKHHYELAAEFYNRCRSKGIQGSSIDLIICAVAADQDLDIWTVDKDFKHYAKVLPINLF